MLYIRTPSEQGLTPKNRHCPKPGQAYFRENASLGCHYHTLTCDIKVISKVRKRRYWDTPCFTIHRAHTLPCGGHSSQGHGTKHSISTLHNFALAKPASILVLSYQNTLCLFFNYYKMWVQFITPHSLDQ